MQRREELSFDKTDYDGVADEERGLLGRLYDDASDAYLGYINFLYTAGVKQGGDQDSSEWGGEDVLRTTPHIV